MANKKVIGIGFPILVSGFALVILTFLVLYVIYRSIVEANLSSIFSLIVFLVVYAIFARVTLLFHRIVIAGKKVKIENIYTQKKVNRMEAQEVEPIFSPFIYSLVFRESKKRYWFVPSPVILKKLGSNHDSIFSRNLISFIRNEPQ